MCHSADTWSAALLLIFYVTILIHAILQMRFVDHLVRRHPAQWKELVHPEAWSDESSYTYSASLWLVLSGEYRRLGDAELTMSAVRARLAVIAVTAASVSWIALTGLTQAAPNFSCLSI